MSISDAALRVLKAATIESKKVTLNSGQLERSLYEEVNEVLSRLDGKWKGGRTQAHIFSYDIRSDLEAIIESGEMPPKNPFSFYETNPTVAQQMVGLLPSNAQFLLDPSAGLGALLDAAKPRYPQATFHAIEIDSRRASILRKKGYTTFNSDFLSLKAGRDVWYYDAILLNPPFDGLSYIDHINNAFKVLSDGGALASIAPVNFKFRKDNKVLKFCELIERHGSDSKLPEDAFAHCGIKIQTTLIYLQK